MIEQSQLVFLCCLRNSLSIRMPIVSLRSFGLLKKSPLYPKHLSRNPNNLPLFLYERFFYQLFGGAGLWVMQVLNMVFIWV